ncbi:MAG: hypothetical protein ACREEM_31755, partial [Blastocatellia bacterium]
LSVIGLGLYPQPTTDYRLPTTDNLCLGTVRGFGVVRVTEKVAPFFAARINRADVLAAAHFPDRGDPALFFDGVIRDFVVMGFSSRNVIGNFIAHWIFVAPDWNRNLVGRSM